MICPVSRLASILAMAALLGGCVSRGESGHRTASFDPTRINELLPPLLKEQKAAGVGVAVIRDGQVIWTGYYGEQAPGIPVSGKTVFNTASVAKTLTAETLLALSAKGKIDLDEPIARYVSSPDLQSDPRYGLLTPRLLMSHRAGLRNWGYEYANGRLAFDFDPGTRFSYSGAGVELAARYAKAKTGKDLQTLAFEYVLSPLGIQEVSMGHIPAWAKDRLAVPMDSAGVFRSVAELDASLANDHANGAADDLVVTVPRTRRCSRRSSRTTGFLPGSASPVRPSSHRSNTIRSMPAPRSSSSVVPARSAIPSAGRSTAMTLTLC